MKLVWALIATLIASPIWAQDLLESDTVKITGEELKYYFDDRLPANAKAVSLTQNKTYREALENIYLIKHFSTLAKKDNLIGEEEEWVAQLELDRVLMKFYIRSYIEKKFQGIDWDALAREEYLVNEKDYIKEETVSASHILIMNSGRGKEKARAEAQAVLDELNAGGEFSELAKKYSEDKGSAQVGGALGYFSRKMMVKPFSEAAFALEEVGDVSGLVESIYGFHIIRLEGRKKAGLVSYEEVKPEIVAKLKEKLRAKLHKDLVFAARSSKNFTINKEKVDRFKEQMEAEHPLPKIGR